MKVCQLNGLASNGTRGLSRTLNLGTGEDAVVIFSRYYIDILL